jgi:hypothetical protein
MGLLKRTTVFIGWLSGSVAGLGALLYAAGYLVTRAHLHLLGLDRLLVPGNERFIEEGANFFLVTGQILIHDCLSLVALAVALVLIGLVVYALLWLCGFPGARAMRSGFDRSWATLGTLHARLPWSPDISAYVALLFLLYVHLLSYLDKFVAPLDLSNLLYEGVSIPTTATSMRGQFDEWPLACSFAGAP